MTTYSHRGAKSSLTRAINSSNPKQVIQACRKVVAQWEDLRAWPDDWHRWNVAYEDAIWALLRDGEDCRGYPPSIQNFEVVCGMVRYNHLREL